MTPAQLHALHSLATAPFVVFIAALIAITCLLVWAIERPRSVDEHTRTHRDGDSCPWCEASDAAVAERERQRRRAQIAKRRTEAARLRALGRHGGAEEQQAEYADAAFEAEVARLLGGEGR